MSIIFGVTALTEPHNADYLAQVIIHMREKWDITSEKVVAFTTANGANIVKAVTNVYGKNKHMPFFAHTLNLVASKPFDNKNGLDETKSLLTAVNKARDVITARDVVVMENTDDSSATTITIDESRPPKEAEEEHDSVSEEQDTSDNPMDETFIPNESSNDTDDSYCDTLSPDDLDVLPTQCDTNLPEKRMSWEQEQARLAALLEEIISDNEDNVAVESDARLDEDFIQESDHNSLSEQDILSEF
ncbi:unnamed protein product [Danaus chrysippus]|uniref:(African queen) hypothetical protein n=1 Tax=Danaus chrysippus TaxID=151541 RepID=A0A8J2VUL9_9NEOP|nr:unnamed protein product [Danaus chrysippus]